MSTPLALALFLANAALVLAVLNAIDLFHLRRKLSARTGPAPTAGNLAEAADPWIESVRAWLTTIPQETLTNDAILAGALPGTASTRNASMRLTAVMKALGYRATRVRLPNRETHVRVWQPVHGAIVELQP